jgi:PKHD-type hydroxylase
MFLELDGVLTPAEVAHVTALSSQMKFIDGKSSNPANITKENMRADFTDPRNAEATNLLGNALARATPFIDFCMPRRVAPPSMLRYDAGMKYGAHGDAALMTVGGPLLRSDLSCTIFLSDPAAYQGGELVIHLGTRPVAIKGRPGSVVVYPSTQLHEVRPVTAGTRLVAITFIESLVPDEHRRTQLYEIAEVLALEGLKMNWLNRVRLELAVQNLKRMWTK